VAHDRFEFEVIGPQRGSDLDQIKFGTQELRNELLWWIGRRGA